MGEPYLNVDTNEGIIYERPRARASPANYIFVKRLKFFYCSEFYIFYYYY